jgi:hypothetical protein
MKRARYLIFFCIVILPFSAVAAPVGNIGDEAIWHFKLIQNTLELSPVTCLSFDVQTNHLPVQITRFPWTNPTILPAEQRHYPQTRWSKNTLTSVGTQIGVPIFKTAFVYALVGATNSKINFHYEDWTVSRTYSRDDEFSSGPDVYYGLGSTIIMQQFLEPVPLIIGMDIKYKRFSLDDDNILSNKTSYSCTLNEIQLALNLSAKIDDWSPYCGVKVSSITGKESYIDQNNESYYFSEGYVHYQNDITWSKDLGFFVGITKYFGSIFSAGLEIRFGDEKGMGINASTRF